MGRLWRMFVALIATYNLLLIKRRYTPMSIPIYRPSHELQYAPAGLKCVAIYAVVPQNEK